MKKIKQCLQWLKGLPYKRILLVCVTVFAVYLVGVLLWHTCWKTYYECQYRIHGCQNPVNCWYGHTNLSERLAFHSHLDGRGFIYDRLTGEHLIENLDWVATPKRGDTLVCACQESRRGYINVHSGKWQIEPQYRHAWIFSCGLAAVEKDGKILFLNPEGKQAFEFSPAYVPYEDYVFQDSGDGYCVIPSWEESGYSLIDRQGREVLLKQYSEIAYDPDSKLWVLHKADSSCVLNDQLQAVLPMMAGSIFITEDNLEVTLPDNTMRSYDFHGRLQNAFCVRNAWNLEYTPIGTEQQKPAKLMVYSAGNYKEGLMTQEGRVVIQPLYNSIEALGANTYLCTLSDNEKVVLNFDK